MERIKIETKEDYKDFQEFLADPDIKILNKTEGKVSTVYELSTDQKIIVPKGLFETKIEKNYKIVLSESDKLEAIEHINSCEILSFDSETTGLNVRKEKIIGISFSGKEGMGFYVPTHEWNVEFQTLVELSSQVDFVKSVLTLLKKKKLIMWNASFDLRIVKNRYGIDLTESLWVEGMLLKHTLEEEGPFALKAVALEIQDKIGFNTEEAANQEQIELKESIKNNGGEVTKSNYELYKADMNIIGKYGCSDADLTLRVVNYYLKRLKEEGLEKFFFVDEVMPLYKEVTVPMEDHGVKLDLDLLEQSREEIAKDIELLEKQVLDELITTDEFNDWYRHTVNKVCEVKASGSFAQEYIEYFGLDIPKSEKTGKYKLGTKIVASIEDEQHRQFLSKQTVTLDPDDEFSIKEQIYLRKEGKPLNIYSKKQMGELVFDFFGISPLSKTDKGTPQFNDNFVEHLANEGHKWSQTLRDYNKLIKIRGAYIDRFLDNHEDGFYFFTYKQHGTVSGRFSSDSQQLSRPAEEGQFSPVVTKYINRIRCFLKARGGYKLIICDQSSLEPRVFASVSNDESLIKVFLEDEDLYSRVAIQAFKLSGVSANKKDENYLKNIYPEYRQRAKAIALAIPYGAGPFQISKTLGIDVKEAEQLIKSYLEAFPNLAKWMKASKVAVQSKGQVSTLMGRVRHLPKVKHLFSKYGDELLNFKYRNFLSNKLGHDEVKNLYRDYKNGINNSRNSQIQGLAASIMNRSGVQIVRDFKSKNLDAYIILQIHDEYVFEVKEEHVEEACKIIQERMENTVKIKVPLVAIPSVADHFGEGHS